MSAPAPGPTIPVVDIEILRRTLMDEGLRLEQERKTAFRASRGKHSMHTQYLLGKLKAIQDTTWRLEQVIRRR